MSLKHSQTHHSNFTRLANGTSRSFTKRTALDPTGHLGSLYDAAYDLILPSHTLQCNRQSTRSRSPASCSVASLNSQDARNLLKWYNIDDELRLSVALQLVQRVGIADMINHSHPIDQYSRVISYEYYSQTDSIPDDEFDWLRRHKKPMLDIRATHVTVLVNWGVCAVAFVQLPTDPKITLQIDNALNKLCASLRDERIMLSPDDRYFLRQIHHREVFSNIPALNSTRSVVDFYHEISRVKYDRNLHLRWTYHLCSIETFYDTSNGMGRVFVPLQQDRLEKIEDYLLFLSSRMHGLTAPTGQTHPNVKRYLNEYYRKMSQKCSDLKHRYKEEIQRLLCLIIDMRRGRTDHRTMDEVLKDDQHKKLTQDVNDIHDNLNAIREKETLIQGLVSKGLEYRNANTYDLRNGDELEDIKQKLLKDVDVSCFTLFNDNLVRDKWAKWNELVSSATKERSEHRAQQIIFVDFTYCTYKLQNFHRVQRTKKTRIEVPLSTVTTSKQRATIESSLPTTLVSTLHLLNDDDTTNILLLGESGVGKSTFINAIANYLSFDTLQQAQPKPHVLIPVSFLMTVGDDFEEKQVKFREQDDSKDEDYSQPGQSVTQNCKSYPFTLRDSENKERKLCLIDTPGFGDVRGLAQDDISMQHILLYLSNLAHLNGVCILMKPNNSRMNIFFRSCFMQLFNLLGESFCDRIMFCFTNARSTFYTPGNSAPLIKQLIESLPIQNIPFNKTNTFCFDTKSFRYLVARENGIEFSNVDEERNKRSWERSSKESKRLLQYIDTKFTL